MGKTFLAVLAAVAMALGLSVGVAQADRGPHDPHGPGYTCTGTPVTCTFGNGHPVPGWVHPCTITAPAVNCTGNLPGGFGGGFGGPRGWPYPGLPGGFPQLIGGNLLSLQALGLVGVNANINVCSYLSWRDFDAYAGPRWGGGWSMARNRWFQANQAEAEWLALRNAAGCGMAPVMVPGGWNGLNSFDGLLNGNYINGSYLNLSSLGLSGLSTVNVCSYNSWDGFSNHVRPHFGNHWNHFQGLFGRDQGMWSSNFNRLRSRANCGPVIVGPASMAPGVEPAPVAELAPRASTPSTEDNTPATVAPAPPSSRGTIIEVPSGPIRTGDAGLAPDAARVR